MYQPSNNFKNIIQQLLPILRKPIVLITITIVVLLLIIMAIFVRPTRSNESIGKVGSAQLGEGSDLDVSVTGDQTKINGVNGDGSNGSYDGGYYDDSGDYITVDQAGDTSWLQGGDEDTTVAELDDYTSEAYNFDYVEADNGDGDLDGNLTDSDGYVTDNGSSAYPRGSGNSSTGGGPSTTVKNGPDDLVMATYNILHAEHHAGNSNGVGRCNGAGVQACSRIRATRQVAIITGRAGNPAFDVFGTQETSPTQYNILRGMLRNYSAFPSNPSRMTNRLDGAVAVWWNNDKYKMFASGKAAGVSNTNRQISNPWVGLQSRSNGRKFYVMSIHYAIDKLGGTPANMRRSSNMTMDWVRSKAGPNTPVFVVGDFNDQLRQKLSYCVYTNGGRMQNALDMANRRNPNKACPTSKNAGIDHIYASPVPGLTASGWTHLPKSGIYGLSSDHSPVYVSFKLKY